MLKVRYFVNHIEKLYFFLLYYILIIFTNTAMAVINKLLR